MHENDDVKKLFITGMSTSHKDQAINQLEEDRVVSEMTYFIWLEPVNNMTDDINVS